MFCTCGGGRGWGKQCNVLCIVADARLLLMYAMCCAWWCMACAVQCNILHSVGCTVVWTVQCNVLHICAWSGVYSAGWVRTENQLPSVRVTTKQSQKIHCVSPGNFIVG